MIRPSSNTYETVRRLNEVCEKVKGRVSSVHGCWQNRLNTYLTGLSLYNQSILQLKGLLKKLEKGSLVYLHVQKSLKKVKRSYKELREKMQRFKASHKMAV